MASTTKADSPNTCEILSANDSVGEFRRDFVCLNDSLHESMQDNPEVIILYVAMVIFVMVFLKMVTRTPRTSASRSPKKDAANDVAKHGDFKNKN